MLCRDPLQTPRTFVWSSTGATSGQLVIGGTDRRVEPSGSLAACARSGVLAVLTVSGAGGSDTEQRNVP